MATNLANEFGDGRQMALRAADAQAADKKSEGFVGELLHSAAYSAFQAPVSGIAQLVGGKSLKDATTFMEKPHEASNFGDWHAQQIGGAIGMALPFALTSFGVHKGFDKLAALRGGTQTAESIGMISMRRAIAESAVAGGLYEGILTPSGDNESLLGGRLRNAAHGAITFGTMTGVAKGMYDSGLLKNRVGIGVVSGLPAGFVSAETDSLLHGKGFASGDDVIKNMYGFAMAGGVLSALHSIPLGERRAPTGDKAADSPTGQTEAPRTGSVEFRIANEQSRAALEAFRSGQKPMAFAEVLKAGEPKRLLVSHDGNVPFELATRADFVASCNLPEVSPFARKLAVEGAYDKPLFMDLGKDTVRIGTEATPESLMLGKENVAKVRSLLDANDIQPESLPRWLGDFKPTGKVWSGNNATVLELASRGESFPDVVLKIKRGDFEGQRDWEADIFNHRGEVDAGAVHETTNTHSDEPLYIFLEDRVDYNHPDTTGYQELMDGLAQRGLQISDPGSGPPVGRSRNSGKWVVADRDAVSKIGSGEHEVERAFAMGGDEYDAQREAEEEASGDRWDEGYGEFDGNDEAAKQAAVKGMKVDAAHIEAAKSVFNTDKPQDAIKSLIEQMTDGLSTKQDVEIMQQYAFANGDAKAAKAQIAFVARLLKSQGIKANDWVK